MPCPYSMGVPTSLSVVVHASLASLACAHSHISIVVSCCKAIVVCFDIRSHASFPALVAVTCACRAFFLVPAAFACHTLSHYCGRLSPHAGPIFIIIIFIFISLFPFITMLFWMSDCKRNIVYIYIFFSVGSATDIKNTIVFFRLTRLFRTILNLVAQKSRESSN